MSIVKSVNVLTQQRRAQLVTWMFRVEFQ